jgi:cyclin C
MAANYWDSTQRRHWTFTKAQVVEMHRKVEEVDRLLVNQYPLPDRRLLNVYFSIRT